jgi:transcriptional regulator with XRE-family HTH domain
MAAPYSPVERENRRRKVASLMLAHWTQQQMAEALGVSRRTISDDVKAVRGEWKAERVEAYDRYRSEEIKRLEALERALWPQAMQGKWLAVDRVLNIIAQRSRLLGTEEPQKAIISVLTPELIERAITERQEKIGALMRAAQQSGIDLDDPPTIDAVLVTTATVVELPRD